MSKYKTGDKFVIEIDHRSCIHRNDKWEDKYYIKGFNTLVFDEYGLDRFERYTERDCQGCMDEWQERVDASFDDGYNHGFEDHADKVREAYEEGLNDAWECVRKIVAGKFIGKLDTGTILNISASEAITRVKEYEAKLKEYEAKQEAEQAKIKVGDEVSGCMGKWIVTNVVCDMATGIDANGDAHSDCFKDIKKTGRHFPIVDILEQMRGE